MQNNHSMSCGTTQAPKTSNRKIHAAPSLAEGELLLAAAGIATFRLRAGRKDPNTAHGVKDARTDLRRIIRERRTHPHDNIGVALGASGLVVLDGDRRNGATWQDLARLLTPSDLARTWITQTADGWHIWFKAPAGDWSTTTDILPGWDLRAGEHYVVAPPSIHPDGPRYQWQQGGPESGLTIQPMPAILAQFLQTATPEPAQRPPSARRDGATDAGDTDALLARALNMATPGRRNDVGYWLACRLAEAGIDEADAELVMQSYARSVPGGAHEYTEREALASLASAYKRLAGNAPRETLPGLDLSIITAADRAQCPFCGRNLAKSKTVNHGGIIVDRLMALTCGKRECPVMQKLAFRKIRAELATWPGIWLLTVPNGLYRSVRDAIQRRGITRVFTIETPDGDRALFLGQTFAWRMMTAEPATANDVFVAYALRPGRSRIGTARKRRDDEDADATTQTDAGKETGIEYPKVDPQRAKEFAELRKHERIIALAVDLTEPVTPNETAALCRSLSGAFIDGDLRRALWRRVGAMVDVERDRAYLTVGQASEMLRLWELATTSQRKHVFNSTLEGTGGGANVELKTHPDAPEPEPPPLITPQAALADTLRRLQGLKQGA